MANEPQVIWLSGNEEIRLISDLLGIPGEEETALYKQMWPQEAFRQTGRSKKLALYYAMLALKVPGHNIRILDHYDNRHSHYMLLRHVMMILDVLGIDHESGTVKRVEYDEKEFTGVSPLEDAYYIKAILQKKG